jgi:hypothetical protein
MIWRNSEREVYLALPQFFLARDRGKSPPRLHKARVPFLDFPPGLSYTETV